MSRGLQITLTLGLAVVVGQMHGQTVFGTTKTNLVTVDVTTGTTTTVGALGLPADSYFVGIAWEPNQQKLFGFVYTVVGGAVTNQFLTRIDPATGATTTIVTLGASASNLTYEGFAYVPTLGTFVASRSQTTNNTLGQDLVTLSTAGVAAALVTTSPAIDNDNLVYDGTRSLFYSIDPNGVNILRSVSLVNGTYTDIGSGVATIGSLAYSPYTDRLYGTSYTANDNSLYVLNPTNAALITTLTTSGDQLTALAVAIPEPASWTTLAAIVGLFAVIGRKMRTAA